MGGSARLYTWRSLPHISHHDPTVMACRQWECGQWLVLLSPFSSVLLFYSVPIPYSELIWTVSFDTYKWCISYSQFWGTLIWSVFVSLLFLPGLQLLSNGQCWVKVISRVVLQSRWDSSADRCHASHSPGCDPSASFSVCDWCPRPGVSLDWNQCKLVYRCIRLALLQHTAWGIKAENSSSLECL